MKVAVIAYSAPPLSAGGVASAHFNLFRMLQKRGIKAKLFTFGDPESDDGDIVRRGAPRWLAALALRISGLVFSILDRGKQAYQVADILKSMWGARAVNREIARFSPDIVVLSDHGAPGLMIRRPKGAKTILVSHHNPARFLEHPELNMSKLDTDMAIWLEQRVLTRIDAVVCPSNYMKEWFGRTYKFEGLIQVIPNLLDEEFIDRIPEIDLRPILNLKSGSPLIYLPSAASKLKGADFLAQIIRQLCSGSDMEIGFYIPGPVDSPSDFSSSTFPANAKLCLAGQVPYEENIAYVKGCSFGISPSLMENYSMALLEAIHCGVPMIAFSTGGNSDIIRDGQNGYLVDEGDVYQLVELAKEFIDEAKLNTIKKRIKSGQSQLSSDMAADLYTDLLAEL